MLTNLLPYALLRTPFRIDESPYVVAAHTNVSKAFTNGTAGDVNVFDT